MTALPSSSWMNSMIAMIGNVLLLLHGIVKKKEGKKLRTITNIIIFISI